ncbi:MAG: acyl-CoA dehydratase activase [Candidatus Omnitrophota bacterium]
MKKYLGIDAGSRFLKYVILDTETIIDSGVVSSGNIDKTLFSNLVENVEGIGLTGYGRSMFLEFLQHFSAKKITEIKAAACGLKYLGQKAATVIDIGGQDTKIIYLDDEYSIKDFTMNDKCAAGTGKFIEMVLKTLDLNLEQARDIDWGGGTDVKINSTCAVFAETEIIQHLYAGVKRLDIFTAVLKSIASRVIIPNRYMISEPVVLSGGTAYFKSLQDWLKVILKTDIVVPEKFWFVNAIGAANYALEFTQQVKYREEGTGVPAGLQNQ